MKATDQVVNKLRGGKKDGIHRGVQLFGSLHHTGRRVVLGHTLNIATGKHRKKKSHSFKFTILYWATFTAILSLMRPAGHRLDISGPGARFPKMSGFWQAA